MSNAEFGLNDKLHLLSGASSIECFIWTNTDGRISSSDVLKYIELKTKEMRLSLGNVASETLDTYRKNLRKSISIFNAEINRRPIKYKNFQYKTITLANKVKLSKFITLIENNENYLKLMVSNDFKNNKVANGIKANNAICKNLIRQLSYNELKSMRLSLIRTSSMLNIELAKRQNAKTKKMAREASIKDRKSYWATKDSCEAFVGLDLTSNKAEEAGKSKLGLSAKEIIEKIKFNARGENFAHMLEYQSK